MRVEFHQAAGEHERYAPHAFDGLIGKTVPWNLRETEDSPILSTPGTATVIAVTVDEDGKGATWTVDFEGDAPVGRQSPLAGFTGSEGMSFSFREDPEIPERWWDGAAPGTG